MEVLKFKTYVSLLGLALNKSRYTLKNNSINNNPVEG